MKKIILSTIPAITLGVAIAPEVNAEEKNYESNAIVEFTPDTSINKPVDPVNPDTEKPVEHFDPTTPDTGNKPNEGTTGPLSIDYASSLDFGKNKISNKDEKYYANPQYFFLADGSGPDLTNPKPNYVQISDKRGTNAGWALTVKQETQLTATKETLNKVLDGSEIKLSQNKAVSNSKAVTPTAHEVTLVAGDSSNVMSAAEGQGSGTWLSAFGGIEKVEVDGESVDKNTAITLTVPGATPKDAVQYKTVLTWTIADLPSV